MNVTPDQIRAARALLRIEQADLAHCAEVSVVTIRRVESVASAGQGSAVTINGIRAALERSGAEFIPAGVRQQTRRDTTVALLDDLRDISLRSAARLADGDILTDADLYDEDGLPG